jgi:hypothetical protein
MSEEECACPQDLLRQLADILASSDGSLSGGAAAPATPAHSQGWWDARIVLDARLAALQGRLDASLLGPWRCDDISFCHSFRPAVLHLLAVDPNTCTPHIQQPERRK